MEELLGPNMNILQDFRGMVIRLTDERLAHILEHPEMARMEAEIERTLENPRGLLNHSAIPKHTASISALW